MAKQGDLLQGTLEMLILKALSLQPIHGYGILVRIQQLSQERLQIQQGSLYPALYRLESRGLIRAEWGESENGRKAKFYQLSPAGKRQLKIGRCVRIRRTAQLTGILKNGFWVKFRGCLAITNSLESCSGPATACTGTKLTRRTRSWSCGCGVSAGTANWSVPAAGGSSARSTTVENGRCVICRGASSRPPYTLRCIG